MGWANGSRFPDRPSVYVNWNADELNLYRNDPRNANSNGRLRGARDAHAHERTAPEFRCGVLNLWPITPSVRCSLLRAILGICSMPIRHRVPNSFAPILWSHELARVDVVRHRKLLIAQAMNYGNLHHLRWLIRQYGRRGVRQTLQRMPASSLRPRARRLASALFNIELSHARRRTH